MELAILENKPGFVDLLIDYNFDLTGFLTQSRLSSFYGLNEVCNQFYTIVFPYS